MPTRKLPDHPNLEHLRGQAKTLLRQVRAADPEAVALAAEFHPVATLADAQLVIARSYGLASWPRLLDHLAVVDRYTRTPHRQPVGGPLETPGQRADEFLRLACLNYGEDDPHRPDLARQLLARFPEVASSNIHAAVVAGAADLVRTELEREPALARAEGGPFRWEPLCYLTYSRLPVDPGAPVAIARLLLDHGADPDAGYLWDGMTSPFTALTGAFGRGEGDQPPHRDREALARVLLEAGADPNDSQTLYNCGPGCPPPYDEVHLDLLLEFGLGRGDGGPWHRRLTVTHPTPRQLLEDELVFAAGAGLTRRVRLMLDRGTDPDGRGTEHPVFCGHRAYELAAMAGHDESADLLRTAGAAELDDVHQALVAVLRGDVTGIGPELAARAVRRDPWLPVRAAQQGRTEAMGALQELGWDLNLMAPATPLHQAALSGHAATVRRLLELGADPTLRDPHYDGTPADWARHGGHRNVLDLLTD